MLELIESAQATGLSAGYVLFGSCISSSIILISLKKECHIDALAMIKKDKTKYLLSLDVTLKKDGTALPARIVYARIKRNPKDWLSPN